MTASPLHALDNHLVSAMLEYGGKKFAEEFLDEAEALDSHPERQRGEHHRGG